MVLARATGLEIITILTLHCPRLILASDSFSWEVQRRSETSANCTILQLSFSIQRYLRNTRGGVDNIILVIFQLEDFLYEKENAEKVNAKGHPCPLGIGVHPLIPCLK